MWDVVIVGGRCAAPPFAMLLARRGHKVLVVDRARFPSDTTSTDFIQPRGTSRPRRWGLEERLLETGYPPLGYMTLYYGAVAISGRPDHPKGILHGWLGPGSGWPGQILKDSRPRGPFAFPGRAGNRRR